MPGSLASSEMTLVIAFVEAFTPHLLPALPPPLTHSPECGGLSWLQSQHLLLEWLLEARIQTTGSAPGTAKWQREGLPDLGVREILTARPSLRLGSPSPW